MNIKPIHSDDDLQESFRHLEKVFQAKAGTQEADEMEILVTLSISVQFFPTLTTTNFLKIH